VNQVLVSVPGGGVLKALATVFTRVHHVLLVAVRLVLGRRSLGGGTSGHHGRLALRQVALPQQAAGGVTAPGSPRRPGGTTRVRRVPVLGAGRRPPGRLVGEAVDGAVVEADGGQVGEALLAHAAGERPLARVHARVDLQRPRLGEALPAQATAVRLLPGVGPLVGPDPRQVGKTSAAEGAGVRPLARVDALVDLQRAGLTEALATVGAHVRPRARVHVLVDAQVAVGVEGLAALCAQEAGGLLGVLRALVLQQLGGPLEGCGAVHAGVQELWEHRGPAALLLLLLRAGLLAARLVGRLTGAEGVLASQVREVSSQRGSVGVRVAQLGAGKAGGEGTVVVVEVVAVGVAMSLRGARVRPFLLPEQLRAGLEPVATQAGKHGEVRERAR